MVNSTWIVFAPKLKINNHTYVDTKAGRPGNSEVPRNPLTRWDVSSTPANGIFLTKKLKNKNKNAQRVENDYVVTVVHKIRLHG